MMLDHVRGSLSPSELIDGWHHAFMMSRAKVKEVEGGGEPAAGDGFNGCRV